ncbi:hypothetical protein CfE428DRAFT_5555 [Chthoniobacter flavus Ellin428]|uniref:Uncharacterized protein n=1 Tax=Chthoniobacter flavus Ellin428 TaxID=497964 RepID=B4D9G5_9BACT|nr:hypothetical protein CfE428DRAFT_5555 [Chthoniobacter flavus Ellin428]TCO87805.1 hypothetical protein EV701_120104 [Chthoniobacter flavus]
MNKSKPLVMQIPFRFGDKRGTAKKTLSLFSHCDDQIISFE